MSHNTKVACPGSFNRPGRNDGNNLHLPGRSIYFHDVCSARTGSVSRKKEKIQSLRISEMIYSFFLEAAAAAAAPRARTPRAATASLL